MAITRKFQLEVLKDRKVTEQVAVYEEVDGRKQREIRSMERIVPESYMVYFIGGHSIWVETKQQLAALNLLPHHNIEIDTDTGLPVLPPQVQDIKAASLRKTQGAMSNG